MIRTFLFICCAILPSIAEAVPLPFPVDSLPGVNIGGGLGSGYESSGIVWHSRLERFIVIDDGGKISTMDVNGNNVIQFNFGGDLEGITIADPSSNLIYVGKENSSQIIELDIVFGWPTRAFGLDSWMPSSGNSGLESLTFVADPNDPEGGLFYVGSQSNGAIYTFRLPIASSSTSKTVEYQSIFQPALGRTDLSGMYYDEAHDVLYAIWDSNNIIRAMRPDGTFLEEWALPGRSQEGITFQGSNLVIAQDNGPVMRYSNFPMIVPEPTSLALGLCALAMFAINRRRR